jgi:hypothetical protein
MTFLIHPLPLKDKNPRNDLILNDLIYKLSVWLPIMPSGLNQEIYQIYIGHFLSKLKIA